MKPLPRRGRGAAVNPPNAFDRLHLDLDPAALDDEERRRVPTQFFADTTRTILARNGSPDIPFTWGLNPYRGCEHGCIYCLSGETLILMGDGTHRPLAELRPGDSIYGTTRKGSYRRFVRTTVRAHWMTEKPAYRVTLADGTVLVASGDHRFLTERGWKFVTGAEQGARRRPHLTSSNKLMGVGYPGPTLPQDEAYRQGYLCGMIRGDGHLASYRYEREGRTHGDQHRFRLALADAEALDRVTAYLNDFGVATHRFTFQEASATRRAMGAIRTSARTDMERIRALIQWPERPSPSWQRGFLAGFFDAEGSYSHGVLRLSNTDETLLAHGRSALTAFHLGYVEESPRQPRNKIVQVLRVVGGLSTHLRFFQLTSPAISRKKAIDGRALKSGADLRIVAIEPIPGRQTLYDITTGTGDFIANGVVSHNCYARPSHEHLGFSAGLDFESKIVVKHDAPRLLAETLQKRSWTPAVVAMSGNTDCYQPVERRLRLTRGCLAVFARHRNPVVLITKNALVLRDLDLLRELAAHDAVHVFVSLTSLRDDLVGAMEPRTSRPAARLQAVEGLAAAGIPVGVFLAPLVPGLTDEEVPALLRAAADHGARTAHYQLLRLPGPVEGLFEEWLRRTHPDRADAVLNRLRSMRGGHLNDARFGHRMRGSGPWASVLDRLFKTSRRRLGLDGTLPALSTAHFRRLAGGQQELFG